jgi:hypothetical protein
MTGAQIALIIFILFILYIVIAYLIKNKNTLSTIQSAETMTKIDATSLASNNTSNFAYSVWFYINDWNYKYGEPKIIFGRMGKASSSGNVSLETINQLDPCPSVVLGPISNDLLVSVACFPGADQAPTGTTDASSSSSKTIVHTCNVNNVPIQKWVNLLVSVYGRTLDMYLDGKLVNTCLLPGVVNVNANAPIYLTPNGGFSGWTSKLQYWSNPLNPQEAWNVYMKGYGGSWLGNIFGKYAVQISVLKNGTETTSVTI